MASAKGNEGLPLRNQLAELSYLRRRAGLLVAPAGKLVEILKS